jgi:hypothetical protein
MGIPAVALVAALLLGQAAPVASLGGTVSDFEQVFGARNDASIGAYVHLERCAGTDVDELQLMAPNEQVWTIERMWCDVSVRSPEDRFADAAQFLPADAVPSSGFTTDRGEPAESFVSDGLASALPATLFHDCAGTSVTVGTLFVVADADGGWYMGPGTCPGG